MNVLCLAPASNSPGKKDATHAFQPEARAFADLHGGLVQLIDNTRPLGDRRAQAVSLISAHIRNRGPLDAFAAFCHGWPHGIQLGFRTGHVELLARTITQQRASTLPFIVVLYACDAARDADDDRIDDVADNVGGIGGFADLLCTALQNQGTRARVFAHSTVGHTTQNPWLRIFSTDDGEPGGTWVIPPRSVQWAKWARAMRETNLRLRVPFMSPSEIQAALGG